MIQLDIQHATKDPLPFNDEQFSLWVETALKPHQHAAALTLRFVEPTEIQSLNHQYRSQDKTTNVLAFPANLPDDILQEYPLLGDVVICPAVLQEESTSQDIPLNAHWAHIVIHGVLHLLGYDHINEADARIMEALEIKALNTLGFDNPYD